MSSSIPRLRRLFPTAAFLGCLPLGLVAAPFSAIASPNAADVTFAMNSTVLWLGHTQVIPLHLKQPADADTTFDTSVLDPHLVEIVRAPVFLAGEQTAYLRVRSLLAGQTRLEVHGGPALNLDVKPDPAEAANARIDQESRRPTIISPMPGAVVWGDFGVGVTLFDNPPVQASTGAPTASPAVPPVASTMKVQLRLPNGRLLDPISVTPPNFGPERQYQFTVPATELPAGTDQLVALASSDVPVGLENRTPAKPVESSPLSLEVKTPPADALWTGACASPAVLGITKNLYAPGRPARLGIEQPNVGKDPNATGGQFAQSIGRGWCLPFIVKTEGNYQMMLRARAEFAGGAYPTVALYVNSKEEPQGLVRVVGSKYDRVPLGTPIHLDPGPQMLSVQFKNSFGGGHENRNVFLDTYELALVEAGPAPAKAEQRAAAPPKAPTASVPSSQVALHGPVPTVPAPGLTAATAPQLSILYPANGAAVFDADAAVVRATGGTTALAAVDLLVDGQAQNVALSKPSLTGPMVFPLIVRGLEPGDHRLAVRATLASGETVDSAARLVTVLAEAPATRGPYERAVWLLDRLAFGPEPKELAAVLTQGESKWLALRLIAPFGSPAEEQVLETSCRRYPHVDNGEQTVARVLNQWIQTDNPVRARFTAWAENHFSTWMTKTKAAPKWEEHLAFCKLGIAPFSDLLEASAHSAAMLVYLDQEKSYAGKINENYAREIMELHTLGVHGGYKQADVTDLAEVLNGWTTAGEAALPDPDPGLRLISDEHGGDAGLTRDFHFVPALNDGKPRRVLGLDFGAADATARYDRIQLALEMLAAHPSTADHVCRKLAEHYVGVPAPDALVHHLAASFLESGGDMRVVLFTLVGDPAFWNAPPKVATPFDYSMRTVRLCRAAALQAGLPPDQYAKPEVIEGFLKRSGMGLFDRVTPDGYPENSDAYADSNALLQRWRAMQTQTPALNTLVPIAWRTPPAVSDSDELNHLDAPDVDPGQRFIDLAAVRLTGRLLSPRSNQAARDVLGQGRPEDLEQALVFVSLLPETSLR